MNASFMVKEKAIVLWPAYFDASRTREEGRRAPKRLCVENPTAEEIWKAAQSLGLNANIEREKAYPNAPWKKEGRILIDSDNSKTSLIQRIASYLKDHRS